MNFWRFDGINRGSKISGCRLTAFVSAAAIFAATAWSQEHFKVDPAASQVHFTLGASEHPVEGTFRVTGGEFTLDAGSGAMTGMVTVDAKTGESGNKSRDKKMTNDELKAQTYPAVTFAPTKLSGQLKDIGDSTGEVEGNFNLLGNAHPIKVPMTVHMEGDHFTAAGSFVVPYVSWGMKDPSWFVLKVEKEVKVDLKLSGTFRK